MTAAFGKNVSKYGAWRNSYSLKYTIKFYRYDDDKKERHLLCNLFYGGGFAHCANWLGEIDSSVLSTLNSIITRRVV
jgi:hypothetical protein